MNIYVAFHFPHSTDIHFANEDRVDFRLRASPFIALLLSPTVDLVMRMTAKGLGWPWTLSPCCLVLLCCFDKLCCHRTRLLRLLFFASLSLSLRRIKTVLCFHHANRWHDILTLLSTSKCRYGTPRLTYFYAAREPDCIGSSSRWFVRKLRERTPAVFP